MTSALAILVGPMGSGKSTVGRALAESLRADCVDTDEMIVTESGLSIAEIFAGEGEGGFRQREHEALSLALTSGAVVISAGGGVVTSEANLVLLRHSDALVVWLDATVEVLTQRIGDDATRPLLAAGDIEQSLRNKVTERADAYAQVADIRIDTSELSVNECVECIVKSFSENHQRHLTCR